MFRRDGPSLKERGRGQGVTFPPGQLGYGAVRLVPAQLEHGAQQTQQQLPVEPAGGADAPALEGGAVGGDGLLLALGQAGAVDGQVPGQVGTRAGVSPGRRPPGAGAG
jgi:hypothetical protein